MPKISVIVPVYKAQAFLERTVAAILGQAFTDFELILVDDGSPDNSGALCDQLAQRDKRIRVIHQENRGASAARNAGLDVACGEFVLFCDSDDMVSPQWMEHLYAAAADGKTLAVCSSCDTQKELGAAKATAVTSGEKLPISAYYTLNTCGLAGFLWNAIFVREVIETHHLRFRDKHSEGDYNEDLLFSLSYVRQMDKLVYVGFADYLYDTREGSLSRSLDRFYFVKYEEKYRLWRAFLQEYAPQDTAQSADLSRTMLYHFFVSLNMAATAKDYAAFKRIVHTDTVTMCAQTAENAQESPRMVALLVKKRARTLWMLYRIQRWKKRLFRR